MSSTTAEATINALRTVFATHGLSEELVTDNVVLNLLHRSFKDFLRIRSNKTKYILSAPYHPASNGEAELKGSKNFQGNDESCQRRSWDPKSEDNVTLAKLSHHSTHHYRMYTSRVANESQTTH